MQRLNCGYNMHVHRTTNTSPFIFVMSREHRAMLVKKQKVIQRSTELCRQN